MQTCVVVDPFDTMPSVSFFFLLIYFLLLHMSFRGSRGPAGVFFPFVGFFSSCFSFQRPLACQDGSLALGAGQVWACAVVGGYMFSVS